MEVPAGMENDRVNLMGNRPLLRARNIPRTIEAGWKPLDEFFHEGCGGCVLEHPDEVFVWACTGCDLICDAPSLHFSSVVRN